MSSATKAASLLPPATLAVLVLLAGFGACTTTQAEPAQQRLDRFGDVVQPFLKNYCLACHGAEKPKAKLDLSGYTKPAAILKSVASLPEWIAGA